MTPYSGNKKMAIVSISHIKHKKTISEIGSVERPSKISQKDKEIPNSPKKTIEKS